MPLNRMPAILLLFPLVVLNGCGGGGGDTATAVPTAASVKVSPTTGITTDESGLTDTISVSLGTKPSADVTIPVSSSDTSEGTVNKTNLVFSSTNWATVQTITVTGVDDSLADGDMPYKVLLGAATSSDSSYNGLDPADVSAINNDLKTGLFDVTGISGDTNEAGQTATFQVKLLSQPTAEVTLPVSSSDTSEGTVDKNSLTFTGANWDQYQTVTVTGVDDPLADGNQLYTIQLGLSSSLDDNYNGLDPADISVTNVNVKTGNFIISAISGNTDEKSLAATFQVQLATQPASDVTIPVVSSDTSEGTVDKASLTFTNADWNSPQTVTVTGVGDTIADGDIAYSIELGVAVSADDNYSGLNPDDVPVTNLDRKTGEVIVSLISGNTDESGKSATFTVALNSQPAADVSILVSSDDPTEGNVSPTSLTFTSGNWSTKTVTVTGVDDSLDDGNQAFTIILAATTSTDNNFAGLDPADVSVTNVDLVDNYGVTPSASAGNYHNLILANDGTVWGWGACSSGQLNAATATCASTTYTLPQRLNITKAAAVSAGYSYSAIIKADRTVWTSGVNDYGQLGHASGAALAPVDGLTDVATTAAGAYHVLALKNDGSVWAWGKGFSGQLGNGVMGVNSQTPVQATGALSGKTVTAIAAGQDHSLALDNGGLVYSWGADGYEQLGDGPGATDRATPAAINLLTGVSAIGAGQTSSFAVGTYNVTADAYAWGQNWDFVLGTTGAGTITDLKNIPTGIGFFTATQLPTRITAGNLHTLASYNNSVYAWGDNDGGDQAVPESQENFGALGNGSYTDRTTPTAAFSSANGTVSAIAAGTKFSLVLLNDGRMQTAGYNQNDTLGTNENLSSILENGRTYYYAATPLYVEDPGDAGTGTITPFYAYRPILSGYPASATTSTTANIGVCTNLLAPASCGPITYYIYSTDNGVSWSSATSIATPISLSALSGTVNLWVKGMKGPNNPADLIQTNASAVKVSWTVN